MQSKTKPRSIESQRGALWSLGLVLVAALCATLVILSWTTAEEGLQMALIEERWQALVGLSGLVLLFVLYATKKHRELAAMQERFQQMAVREASLRARLGELSFLFDTSTQLQLRLDMQSMLELATQRLLSCFEAHQSSIMLHNPETGMLEVRAVSGVDANLVAGSVTKPGEGIAGTAFTSGESLLLTPESMALRFPNDIKPGRSITSSLIVPMRFRGTAVGVVSVCRTDQTETFTPMHMQMLESFAEHCAATFVKTTHHQTMLKGVRRAA
jgi:transcriptional regulator with GAF, ATPase, and Fis domain